MKYIWVFISAAFSILVRGQIQEQYGVQPSAVDISLNVGGEMRFQILIVSVVYRFLYEGIEEIRGVSKSYFHLSRNARHISFKNIMCPFLKVLAHRGGHSYTLVFYRSWLVVTEKW
jgi:hypothetical protein